MSAREELAALIGEQLDHPPGPNCPACADAYRAAEAILEAGWRKPRTITTEEELDTLPAGSVVLSDCYRHMVTGWPLSFQKWDDGYWHRGARSGSTHPDNFLPATVLHEPEPQS